MEAKIRLRVALNDALADLGRHTIQELDVGDTINDILYQSVVSKLRVRTLMELSEHVKDFPSLQSVSPDRRLRTALSRAFDLEQWVTEADEEDLLNEE
jgi:hypothetical protein